jgi:hypothetical protein
MSKFPLIEADTIDKFIELVSSGTTKTEAAQLVGRDLHSIRLWLKSNGMEMPDNSSPITALVMSHADDYASGRMTQTEIATACSCSAPYVSTCLGKYTADHLRSKRVKVIKQIIDHIKQHGGRPKATARKLGLPFNSTPFYEYIRAEDINLRPYEFAGAEHGSWLVVAGDWRKGGSNYYVPALCRRCGTVYQDVNLNNLRGGRSTCCQSCSTGNKEGQTPVKCLTTGTIYKSVMSMCDQLGVSDAYQSLRLQLKKQDTVIVNDCELQLVKR